MRKERRGLFCDPYRLMLAQALDLGSPKEVTAPSFREAYQNRYQVAYDRPLRTTADWREAACHVQALEATAGHF